MNNKDKDKLSLYLTEALYLFCFVVLGYFLAYDYLTGIVFIGITIILLVIMIDKLNVLIEEEE